MKRKLLTLMTALAVVLTLSACGEAEDDTPITRVTTTTAEADTEVTDPSTETETSAETDGSEETVQSIETEEPVTEPVTEESTEPSSEATTAEPEETEHTVEEGITSPDGETEEVTEEEAATMMLVVGDWLNNDTYAEGITKDAPFRQMEDVNVFRAGEALYLEAYVLNYEPIYDEDGFFIGLVTVDGHGIGYYSLLGETETLTEHRLYPLEGLPVSTFRLREMDGEGALYLDGHGTFGEDEDTIAAFEEFPLTREGARQEVYTASGFNLNMRDLPSIEGEAITALAVGTQVYAIDFHEAQFVLAVTEGSEYLGFVSGEFLVNPGEAPEETTEDMVSETTEDPGETEESQETEATEN